jgi:glycosyltransferase involved in cell wall biosynthesis
MRPHFSVGAQAPTVYVDAQPLWDRHPAGIGRYTARICLALAARYARVRFFFQGQELLRSRGLDWSQDQDLGRWCDRALQSDGVVPLTAVPDDAIALWTNHRPCERTFPVELSFLHDLGPLIVPVTHDPQSKANSQFLYAKSLLSSDAALAVSHSTKADAAWLSDFPQDRILVVPPGPSQCVGRHLHDRHVTRRSHVGLLIATLEPRDNAQFVIDWFRSSNLLPADTVLWWVSRSGCRVSSQALRDFRQARRGRRVRLLGPVSDKELCKLYQTAGWSVHASLYEGFGFPVLDSLRHGVPVLTSCNSSLRELAHPGVYFFDPHDVGTLDRAWTEYRAAQPNLNSPVELDGHQNWDRAARAILDTARAHQAARPSSHAKAPSRGWPS